MVDVYVERNVTIIVKLIQIIIDMPDEIQFGIWKIK